MFITVYATIQKSGVSKIFFFFKETMLYDSVETFIIQINAVLLNFMFKYIMIERLSDYYNWMALNYNRMIVTIFHNITFFTAFLIK